MNNYPQEFKTTEVLLRQILFLWLNVLDDSLPNCCPGNEHHPDDIGLSESHSDESYEGGHLVVAMETKEVHEEDEKGRSGVSVVKESEEVEDGEDT